jgi:hypothetical protein
MKAAPENDGKPQTTPSSRRQKLESKQANENPFKKFYPSVPNGLYKYCYHVFDDEDENIFTLETIEEYWRHFNQEKPF